MRKRVISALLALVMVAAMLPVMPSAAAGYSKSQLDSLMDVWNSGVYAQNKNTSYGGATQCAAFTRFLFDKLWGHYDGESNTNNKLMPSGSDDIPCTTEAQLMNYLKSYAKPGDSVRLSSSTGDHIVHLYDIDVAGNLSFYESNFEGNSKNKARFMVSTLKDFLGDNQTRIASVKNDGTGTLNRTVYLTIIHALNNTATQFSFVCSHKYVFINDNKVACEKCSAVYVLPTPTDVRIYMDVTKNNAPAHSSPYGDADIGARYDKGHTVYVVGKVQNAFNNTWYKLSSGEWMVSDYLGEHYHCWSAGGYCTRCLGQGDDMKFSPIWLGDVPLKISSGGKKIPVHYAPYGDSLSFKTIKDKSQVVLDAKVINGYGHIWYRLSFDAGWIYGGYVDTYAQDAKASKEITIGYGPGPSPSVYTKQGTIPAGKAFTVYPKEVSQEGGASWVSARYGDILGFIPSGSFTTTGSGKQVGASETPEATGDSVTSNLPDSDGGGTSGGGSGSSSSGGNVAQGDQNGSAGPSLIKVQYPTNQTYLDKFYVGVDKAVLVANITKQAGIAVDECGIILYHADGSFMWEHKEDVSHLGASLTNFHAWYDTYEELGIELEPNTTYQYQFYAIANQTIYMQPMQNFTTLPDPAESEPQAPAQYTLTFDPNGGTCDTSGKTVTFDSAIGTMPVPARDGYRFDGWYTAADGGSLIGETTRYTTQGNLTLYAHWSAARYKLIFDANGGTCTRESQEVDYNTPLGSLPEPTRSGYTFDGWYTAVEDGSKVGAQTNYNAAYDVTVYAHWTPNQYKLILDPNGGTCDYTMVDVTFDSTIDFLPTPTKFGYTFSGWYTAADGGKAVTLQTRYNAPYDFTVYAHWTLDTAGTGAAAMKDVPADAWYFNAVDFVVRNGVMGGYNDTTFGPNDYLNRAMLVQMLYNREGKPTVNSKSKFTDVASSDWFASAVIWASAKGIASGYGSTYQPNNSITRQEVAQILYNYATRPEVNGNLSRFPDAYMVSDWATQAVTWAVETGIMGGKGGGMLDPLGKATRAEAAQMLTNFLAKGYQ